MARIEYSPFETDPTPADPSRAQWLPLIPITFRGERDHVTLDCLADTGSCEIVLPFHLMDDLGARAVGAKGTLNGAEGSQFEVTYGKMELEITLDRIKYRWRSVIGFTEARDDPVLGDAGFFRYFSVTFLRSSRYMLVHPPHGLPRLED